VKKQWIDDSYDKRKRGLLTWLRKGGHIRALAVVPMATDATAWSEEDYRRYVKSLGNPDATIATKALFSRSRNGNPGSYFGGLGGIQGNVDLFLDPDSGLTKHCPGNRWQNWNENAHVAVSEVIELVRADVHRLVLVYDHTVPRSADADSAKASANARVTAFQNANAPAVAWFWERAREMDPLVIIGVSSSADRVSRIRLATGTLGASGVGSGWSSL